MRIHDHSRQPWRQRQRAQALALLGDAAIGVERIELAEQALGLLQRRCGRRIEEGQARRIADAPLREVEHQRRQIGGEDFRLRERRKRRGLRLVPQPVADTRLGTAGTAAALIDRRARGAHRLEPRQADVRLIARHAREPRIHHDAHALDGERGFGNRRRQHHLALAFRRRCNGAILHRRIERTEQRHDLDCGIMNPLAEESLGAADLGRAGQEREHRTGICAKRARDRLRHLPLQRRIGLAAEIARFHGESAALAGDDRSVAQEPADPRAVERRRHHQKAQILAQAGLRIARQRETEIGVERTLVEFVEQHGRDAGEFGIVEDLAREDSLGDHLDSRRPRDL